MDSDNEVSLMEQENMDVVDDAESVLGDLPDDWNSWCHSQWWDKSPKKRDSLEGYGGFSAGPKTGIYMMTMITGEAMVIP